MGPWNKQRLLFVLGCFVLVFYSPSVESYEHARHGKRIKRFLFNKVEEPNTVYSKVTLCCTCNDFDKTNTCYEKCRIGGGLDLCFDKLCSTTATLLNGRFYLATGCVSDDICRQERDIYQQTPGCLTLNKNDVRNGTKCGYCCQSRDVRAHGSEASRDCIYNLDHLIDHVYGQNTEKTVAPSSSCQGNECQVSKFSVVTKPEVTTYKPAVSSTHSLVDYMYLYKLCTSDAALGGKSYFPFPDDNRHFIECGKAGHGTIQLCPEPLVWNDLKQTCDFIFNIITKVTTKPSSTLFKTTLQTMAKSISTSPSLSQLLSKTVATLSPVPVSTNTSTVNSKSTLNHLSPVPTLGKNEVTCDTCTIGTNCMITKCQSPNSYCRNVVMINPQGKQTVLKKGCASYYECKYDHSSRNSECGSQGPSRSITTNISLSCQYCCQATNNLIACNAENIPKNIAWFDEKKVTTSRSCQGTKCQYSEVSIHTTADIPTKTPTQSSTRPWVDYLHKVCTSNAA